MPQFSLESYVRQNDLYKSIPQVCLIIYFYMSHLIHQPSLFSIGIRHKFHDDDGTLFSVQTTGWFLKTHVDY